jgi:RHS repeat-associated core domain
MPRLLVQRRTGAGAVSAGRAVRRHRPIGLLSSCDRLGSVDGTSSYIYDADGNLLLRKEPGKVTLYLPGQQTTLDTATNTATSVRYYPLPGGNLAIRTGTGTSYRFAIVDPHGTADLLLDNIGQTPAWRQFAPFGAPRGAAVTWPDNRGFLNAPVDGNTGLSILGARHYDPTLGRFISLAPVVDGSNPLSGDGYAYAQHNPNSFSDPHRKTPVSSYALMMSNSSLAVFNRGSPSGGGLAG